MARFVPYAVQQSTTQTKPKAKSKTKAPKVVQAPAIEDALGQQAAVRPEELAAALKPRTEPKVQPRDEYEITQNELEQFKSLKDLEKSVEVQLTTLRKRILQAHKAEEEKGEVYIEPGERRVIVSSQERTLVEWQKAIDARWGIGQAALIKAQTPATTIDVLQVD